MLPSGDQAGTGPTIRMTDKAGVARREGVARPELRHWRRRAPGGTRRLAVAVDRAKERVSSRQ